VFALAAILPMPWAWPAAIPGAVSAALLAALCIQAESTPFTAGANDNASAVGMVLTLARHFARRPLERTRVLAVITGCEEVQHYGMADFYRRHRAELKEPRAVIFEMLGCAGPSWLVKEGIIVPFRPDPMLLALVEKLAVANPGWGAYPSSISGGNTEMADAVRARVPAIALGGMTRKGVLPFWHQLQDTFDKMDPAVMARTWEMTLALIREIDRA
jgi:Zn-dependent M28 family amino/carboxypeptidase